MLKIPWNGCDQDVHRLQVCETPKNGDIRLVI